ncbi:MAG TPA: N-6 DNA methylase [Jatrophihabitantaceae bacterium]|nr:N-6 DNA methylase [Jatrophihabitantaceae bacterium]
MLPGDTDALRKARGAFFTPAPIARFVAEWAIRSAADAVLEPSCGEAVFLHEAGRGGRHRGPLIGIELHAESAAEAQRTLRAEEIAAEIRSGDFFLTEPSGDFDAVIGNPPYVRYQDFAGDSRARSRAAALRAGVSLTGLASSWAAFTVHSALFLKPGGRLGLVLPAELLTVNYATDVRRFLMQHFRSVGLVMFVERVFPGVLEEVVLLLADGFDPSGQNGTDHCDVYQVQNADDLSSSPVANKWRPASRSAKWTASLLAADAAGVFAEITSDDRFGLLQDWGETTLGMVTGNNGYFALSPERADELALSADDLVPLSPPGSRHLRGLAFTTAARHALGEQGSATWLFRPTARPSAAAQRYIDEGEARGVHLAYKCRVRTPWWRVPYLKPADLLLTYMNADAPRLVTNRARAHHLNSVHGVYLRPELRRAGADLLPLACLNSATLVGAETVGRAYGGGMLKLEPREADALPVPGPAFLAAHREAISALRPAVVRALSRGRLADAVAVVDEVLLVDALGLDAAGLHAIRDARSLLAARRTARGRRAVRDA